jgi:iron complex transport system substrate-binding protein
VCTAPKFSVDGASADIDHQVKEALAAEISVYRVHAELLRSLRPEVILTQSQCAVCAVSPSDIAAALGDWPTAPPQIVSLMPNALPDVWCDMERVATALGVNRQGRELVGQLQQRMAAVHARAAQAPERPRVGCIEWIDPLMAAGNWMPELVDLSAGIDAFGKPGIHAPPISFAQLERENPDVIVIMPCGLDIPRTRRDMPALTRHTEWATLRAVRSHRVYLADGNQYFNRPGPRIVDSLEILAEILHPECCKFGHEGSGWERFEPAG